jgi:hypothetical protein
MNEEQLKKLYKDLGYSEREIDQMIEGNISSMKSIGFPDSDLEDKPSMMASNTKPKTSYVNGDYTEEEVIQMMNNGNYDFITGNSEKSTAVTPSAIKSTTTKPTSSPTTKYGTTSIGNDEYIDQELDREGVNRFMATKETNNGGAESDFSVDELRNSAGSDFTTGDIYGASGQAIADVIPTLVTMVNAITDRPRVNALANYGKNAQNILESEKGMLYSQYQTLKEDRLMRENTMKHNADLSSRGTNTAFAKRLGIHEAGLRDDRATKADYINKILGVTNRQANLSLSQDEKVMQENKWIAEMGRKEKDNFANNIGTNMSDVGTSLQQYGKQLNDKQYAEDSITAMNNGSPYAKWVKDPDGNWYLDHKTH